MNSQLQTQICPYCDKEIPLGGYCVYCSKVLPNYNRCTKCNAILSINVLKCPSCDSKVVSFYRNEESRILIALEVAAIKFQPAILIIFIFATYSVVQLTIGFIAYFFIPNEIDIENNVLSSLGLLFILIMSNVLMIGFITRIFSFSFEEKEKTEPLNKLWLVIILVIAISLIDIFTSIVDFFFDFMGISSTQTSPYDQFFGDLVGIFVFTILAAFIGPIFEELVYRRYAISAMSKLTDSKTQLICFSALIFAFSHISSDLLNGSLRYTLLHFCATSILGIILGIVFFLWGLRGAIIFHSSWNIFSLFVQLLVDNGLIALVELLIILFTGITFIIIILSVFHFKTHLRKLLFEFTPFVTNELMLVFANFILIIVYTIFPVLLQILIGQNFVTIGINLILYILGIIPGLMLLGKNHQSV